MRRPSQLPSAVRPAPNSGRHGSRPSNRTESGAGAPRSKTFCIGTYASAGFNFSPQSYRVDLNCLKSDVLPGILPAVEIDLQMPR